jgi:hypothetical protein
MHPVKSVIYDTNSYSFWCIIQLIIKIIWRRKYDLICDDLRFYFVF